MADTMPTQEAVRAWTRMARAQQRTLERIEGALKRAELPPLAWYDVLLELSREGAADGIRPFELERALLLPQYGLSRLIDRIARSGLIERRPCAEDGRGHLIAITGDGRELLGRMWPVYGGALAATVDARLTRAEAASLARLLDKLLADEASPLDRPA